MKKFTLAVFTLIFSLFAGLSIAATDMPLAAGEAFLEGVINTTDRYHVVFYDTDASGACIDTTYDTYVNTNQVPDATTEYELHDGGPYTTSSTGSVAWILSESFDQVTSLVMTLTSATFTDADCLIIYHDTDADDEASTGDIAIYKSDITSISPSGDDVNITFPADGSGTALIQMTVPN